jgi:hypothetical protein
VVRDGGRTLVGRGLAEGQRAPITMRLVDARSARYRGSVMASAVGAVTRMHVDWRVITPERIEGRLTARIRSGGRRCTIARDFILDHIRD